MKKSRNLILYTGLPRSVYILFLSRVINCLGNFVFPFLTTYLTLSLSMGAKETGIIITLASLAYLPGSVLGGKLADLLGRKLTMILFQFLSASCLVPCAFLGKSMIIPYLLILNGFFSGGSQPANSAMVADLTDKKNRQAAFSLLYLGINIGSAIGPLAAGLLYISHLRWIFLGDAATTYISLVLVALFVKESLPQRAEPQENLKDTDSEEMAVKGSIFSVLAMKPMLVIFALISAVYSFVYVQQQFSMPMLVNGLFGKTNGPEIYGSLMSVNAIVVITMTTIMINITKNFKPVQNLSFAGVFYAIGFGMMFFIRSYPLFMVSTIMWTIGEILISTNTGVYIANHTPESHRGRFNGIFNVINGLGHALGPVLMGGYIAIFTIRAVWPLIFVIALAGAALMYALYRSETMQDRHTDTKYSKAQQL